MKKDSISRRDFIKSLAGAAVTVVLFGQTATGEKKGKVYAYIIDSTKCIGCGNCVRACSKENDVPEEFYRTWIERYTMTNDGKFAVESPEGGKHSFSDSPVKRKDVALSFFVPKICNHCAKPPCVQVCPVGATFKRKDGAVLIDPEHCVGCGYCVQSCPYAARFINPKTHTADKCSWCYHRVTKGMPPACVFVCPVKARRFGEVSSHGDVYRDITQKRVSVLKGDLGTEPSVYYIGLSKEVR